MEILTKWTVCFGRYCNLRSRLCNSNALHSSTCLGMCERLTGIQLWDIKRCWHELQATRWDTLTGGDRFLCAYSAVSKSSMRGNWFSPEYFIFFALIAQSGSFKRAVVALLFCSPAYLLPNYSSYYINICRLEDGEIIVWMLLEICICASLLLNYAKHSSFPPSICRLSN